MYMAGFSESLLIQREKLDDVTPLLPCRRPLNLPSPPTGYPSSPPSLPRLILWLQYRRI